MTDARRLARTYFQAWKDKVFGVSAERLNQPGGPAGRR